MVGYWLVVAATSFVVVAPVKNRNGDMVDATAPSVAVVTSQRGRMIKVVD